MEVSWDKPLPGDAAAAWQTFQQELPVLVTLQINCLVPRAHTTYELHGFSDNSEAVYAAAVYLRVVFKNYDPCCHLLMGKSG